MEQFRSLRSRAGKSARNRFDLSANKEGELRALRKALGKSFGFLHAKRESAIWRAVEALLIGGRLWPTALGRDVPGPAKEKPESRPLHGMTRPVVLVDWTRCGPDRYLLRAVLPTRWFDNVSSLGLELCWSLASNAVCDRGWATNASPSCSDSQPSDPKTTACAALGDGPHCRPERQANTCSRESPRALRAHPGACCYIDESVTRMPARCVTNSRRVCACRPSKCREANQRRVRRSSRACRGVPRGGHLLSRRAGAGDQRWINAG
jgi:hypothetical protein